MPRNSGNVPTHITPLIGIETEPYRTWRSVRWTWLTTLPSTFASSR